MAETITKLTALIAILLLLAMTAAADAQTRRRVREHADPAPRAEPADKRDSIVALPGSPFNSRPYWQALGQCGGIYFRLVELATDAAIQARVVKPDKAADARFSSQADDARAIATAFFVAAEKILVADRSIERDDAIPIYDAKASEAGSRLKTSDVALAAAKPCPALYQACQLAFAKVCGDVPALAH
jgi:hypothetical protein